MIRHSYDVFLTLNIRIFIACIFPYMNKSIQNISCTLISFCSSCMSFYVHTAISNIFIIVQVHAGRRPDHDYLDRALGSDDRF